MTLFNPTKERRTKVISNELEHFIVVQLIEFLRAVIQVLVLLLIITFGISNQYHGI